MMIAQKEVKQIEKELDIVNQKRDDLVEEIDKENYLKDEIEGIIIMIKKQINESKKEKERLLI